MKTINWKEAKSLIVNGTLKAIGRNLFQINNQGEFYLSYDKTKLYKRRKSSPVVTIDLIAQL